MFSLFVNVRVFLWGKTIFDKHLFLIVSNLYDNHNNQWHFPQYFLLFFGTVNKIVDDRGTPENTFCFTVSLFPQYIFIFFLETMKSIVDDRDTPENTFCFTFGHPGHPVEYYMDKCSFSLSNMKSQ